MSTVIPGIALPRRAVLCARARPGAADTRGGGRSAGWRGGLPPLILDLEGGGVEFRIDFIVENIAELGRFGLDRLNQLLELGIKLLVLRDECLGVVDPELAVGVLDDRSEEHTSELQSLMRISYAVFCLKIKKKITKVLLTSF